MGMWTNKVRSRYDTWINQRNKEKAAEEHRQDKERIANKKQFHAFAYEVMKTTTDEDLLRCREKLKSLILADNPRAFEKDEIWHYQLKFNTAKQIRKEVMSEIHYNTPIAHEYINVIIEFKKIEGGDNE